MSNPASGHNVRVLLRNEEENNRRVCLGVYSSEEKAREALLDDMSEYGGVYDEGDYDVLPFVVDDDYYRMESDEEEEEDEESGALVCRACDEEGDEEHFVPPEPVNGHARICPNCNRHDQLFPAD